jgi:exopolyphosphatase/guanosine-5'-triphosphate,3'-diphosphate pyrophosphatase
MPGLEPGREYVIVAGTVILRRIMETFGFDTCRVSDFGLREGILVDLATKKA